MPDINFDVMLQTKYSKILRLQNNIIFGTQHVKNNPRCRYTTATTNTQFHDVTCQLNQRLRQENNPINSRLDFEFQTTCGLSLIA